MIHDPRIPSCPSPDTQRRNPHLYGPPPEKRAATESAHSERELHNQILDWLHMKGVKGVVRSRMDKKSTLAVGVPDMLLAVRGVAVALEVKVGSNEPTPEQLAWLADLKADGWIAEVVRSLDDVIKVYNMAKLYVDLHK